MTNEYEIWKDIPGWEGKYQASNVGRIRSLPRTRPGRSGAMQQVKGRILSPIKAKGATYAKVCLSEFTPLIGKKVHQVSVHRAVLCAFTGKDLNYPMEADHIDGDAANNLAGNLRWATRSLNVRNRFVGVGASSTVGVWLEPARAKPLVAKAILGGKTVFEKYFLTEAEAVTARKHFEEKFDWRETGR